MNVTIQLFAAARELVGYNQVQLDIEEHATVKTLQLKLAEKYPALKPLLQQSIFAVNAQYASESTRLDACDEIACIPPVSGG